MIEHMDKTDTNPARIDEEPGQAALFIEIAGGFLVANLSSRARVRKSPSILWRSGFP